MIPRMARPPGRLLWIAELAVCLVFSACQGPTDGGGGDTETVKTGFLGDDDLGMSLIAPIGWSGRTGGTPPLRMTLVKKAFDSFQPTVNVVADAYPGGASLQSLLAGM